MKLKFFLYFIISLLLSSCRNEKVAKIYTPNNAHDAYKFALKQAGLDKTALGRDWISNSQAVLNNPIQTQTPTKESLYFDASQAQAYGFKFNAKRGQKISIKIDLEARDSVQIFVDIFRVIDYKTTSYYKVASLPKDSSHVEFIARRESEYILRLQPELLRNALCTYSITKDAAFLFPVMGKNKNDIHSFFGDPRDGGKRDHHGVDIFANKNTPVISPERAYVSSVGTGKIGGKYVWLYYPKISANLYFAHLETQDVEEHKWINPGTQIGTVGNTGNARFTPPHLHFGVYMSGTGPVDPFHFISKTNEQFDYKLKKNGKVGKWLKTNRFLKLSSVNNDSVEITIMQNTAVYCLSEKRNSNLITLPDGQIAYIKSEYLSKLRLSNKINYSGISKLYDKPAKDGLVIEQLSEKDSVHILAEYSKYHFVKTIKGKLGWIPMISNQQSFHSVR